LSRSHRLCRFARRRNKGNSRNYSYSPPRSSFCPFCGTFIIPCDWLFHERVFLSHGKKEQKSLLRTARSLSVISVISAGHYYLMHIVFLLSRCHRLCRFARRRNQGNKGNLHPPLRSTFCYFCPFCGTLLSHAHSIFIVPQNKGNKGNLLAPSAKHFLLFLLFLRDDYYLMRIVLLLSRSHRLCRFARRSHRLCRFACRRNKGNKGNSSFGCCLRSAFGLKTSGSGTSES